MMKQINIWTIVCGSVLFLLTAACASTGETMPEPSHITQEPGPPEIRILAFGDSLTAGFGVDAEDSYPSQLQARLRAEGTNAEVVNGGISGETSSAALARVDWMMGTRPDIVIVETGGNDALRGVDLDLTASNLDQIVNMFTENEVVVIVAGMQIIQNLGQDYTEQFAGIYPAVSAKYDAVLIPFFLEGVAADPGLNQADFIHPNAAGYAVLVDYIYPFVIDAIGRLR